MIGRGIDLEGAILIGGRSSRFGQDKALVNLDGVTLAERAASTISAALSPKQIYLVARDENQFAAEALPKNIPLIYDQYKDRGAYGGVHAALSKANAAKTEWTFTLACDYPFVSTGLLRHLSGFVSEEFEAVVPVQPDGRVQPLCAFYRTAPCLKIVEEILRADGKLPPLYEMFEKIKTRLVGFDEIKHLPGADNFFLNLNSREDLEKAKSNNKFLE